MEDFKQIEKLVEEFLAFFKRIVEMLKETIADLGLDSLLAGDKKEETTDAPTTNA